MTPTDPMSLAAHVRHLGVTLTVDGSGLHVVAPSGTLTTELRTALTQHRAVLTTFVGIPPTPGLAAFYAALTSEERERLHREAGSHALARIVLLGAVG